MNKYVIAYLNFHSNNIKQVVYLGTSEYAVAIDYLATEEGISWTEDAPQDFEELLDMLFNMDIALSVLKI